MVGGEKIEIWRMLQIEGADFGENDGKRVGLGVLGDGFSFGNETRDAWIFLELDFSENPM